MCESKASIWWKTVHWSQCNSHEGMHRQIQVPSRYLSNLKGRIVFIILSPQSFLVISTVHSLLTWIETFGRTLVYWLVHMQSVIGAHIGVLTQHATQARHTRQRKGNNSIVWSCFNNVNASAVLFFKFPRPEKKSCSQVT